MGTENTAAVAPVEAQAGEQLAVRVQDRGQLSGILAGELRRIADSLDAGALVAEAYESVVEDRDTTPEGSPFVVWTETGRSRTIFQVVDVAEWRAFREVEAQAGPAATGQVRWGGKVQE